MAKRRVFPMGSPVLAALVVYAVLGLLLLPHYRYHLNPDAMSYISVAHKYLIGDYSHALNLYWAPLLSWLLVPFLAAHVEPLLAVHLVFLLAGALLILIIHQITKLFPVDRVGSLLVLWLAVPLTLSFAYWLVTPDMLFLATFLAAFALLADPKYPRSWWRTVAIGILGALSYFAKSFAFYFFPLYFLCATILWFLMEPRMRGRLATQFVLGMVVFLLICAPWVAAISGKLGAFTISEAGKVNRTNDGVLLSVSQLPEYSRGLMAPTDPQALSVWDDPSTIPRTDWSPFQSRAAFMKQMKAVVLDAINFFQRMLPMSWLLFFFIGVYILLLFPLKQALSERRIVPFTLLVFALLYAAYLPFLIEFRYFWPMLVLILPMGAHVLTLFSRSSLATATRVHIAAVLFALSVLTMPLWNMALDFNDGNVFAATMTSIGSQLHMTGVRIASDYWKTGLYFAYYVDGKYYGQPIKDATLEKQLLENKIDYYVVWSDKPKLMHFVDVTPAGVTTPRVMMRK